jgi:hypothetical protein
MQADIGGALPSTAQDGSPDGAPKARVARQGVPDEDERHTAMPLLLVWLLVLLSPLFYDLLSWLRALLR